MESQKVYVFDMETDPATDLLDDATLDALYEAGCDDALVGHHWLAFARRADTWDEALTSARANAESVPGVRVVAVKIDAEDVEAEPRVNPARPSAARAGRHQAERSAAAV